MDPESEFVKKGKSRASQGFGIIPALLHPDAEGIDRIYQYFPNDARQNTALNGRGVKGIFP